MIRVGTLCYLAGLKPGTCQYPSIAGSNGRVVTVCTPLLPMTKSVGGFAYGVEAPWLSALSAGTCYIVPWCLIPIAPPTLDPATHRQPEAQPA